MTPLTPTAEGASLSGGPNRNLACATSSASPERAMAEYMTLTLVRIPQLVNGFRRGHWSAAAAGGLPVSGAGVVRHASFNKGSGY
jgi:hypothetical protein